MHHLLLPIKVMLSPTFMFQLAACRRTEGSSGSSYFIHVVAQMGRRTLRRRRRRFWGTSMATQGREYLDLSSSHVPFHPAMYPCPFSYFSWEIWRSRLHACRARMGGCFILTVFIHSFSYPASLTLLINPSYRHHIIVCR